MSPLQQASIATGLGSWKPWQRQRAYFIYLAKTDWKGVDDQMDEVGVYVSSKDCGLWHVHLSVGEVLFWEKWISECGTSCLHVFSHDGSWVKRQWSQEAHSLKDTTDVPNIKGLSADLITSLFFFWNIPCWVFLSSPGWTPKPFFPFTVRFFFVIWHSIKHIQLFPL